MQLQDIYRSAARAAPDTVAVEAPDGHATYAEIDVFANRVAHALVARGVASGDRVGLWLDKSVAAIAAMQGILRIGAAYVPLDPVGPVGRAQTIAADCGLRIVVTDEERAAQDLGVEALALTEARFGGLPGPDTSPPTPASDPDALAYILYTSGSTGTPKGVCLSHRNALSYIDWAAAAVDARPGDRFSNHAPFHFDLSVFDVYVSASARATLVIIPEGSAYLPKRLVATMIDARISVWYSVPSALIMMMAHGKWPARAVEHTPRVVVFAGEPFPIDDLRQLRDLLPNTRLWNFYGPTETNVCTAYEVHALDPEARSIPIGGPASSDTCYALRPDGAPAGPGEEGELIVEGPTVMLGYWGRPPLPSRRYATGDRVRVRADGGFDYLGRKDQMVKVRGHRVELGEVEAVLAEHPAVRHVAVAVTGSSTAAKLVAFVVPDTDTVPGILDLKRFSAPKLPRYMLVDRVRALPELPRTRNGKLDRLGLERILHES